jgi:hypothetical protein
MAADAIDVGGRETDAMKPAEPTLGSPVTLDKPRSRERAGTTLEVSVFPYMLPNL